jgi:undecaprenyl-diphosphatase
VTWWESILLGLIQGLTEFLPVSSSGHLELGKALFGIENGGLAFTVLVHGATAMSTIVVFRADILQLLRDMLTRTAAGLQARKFAGWILLSMIPVGIVGFSARDFLEAHAEGQVGVVGAALLVTAALLWFAHSRHESFKANSTSDRPISTRTAIWMGLAQAIAIVPGVSRSGATISTGLLLGLSPATAARFSFLMVLPPILGMTALEVKDLLEAPALLDGQTSVTYAWHILALGAAAAFISGLWACKWMMRGLIRGGLKGFAIYCAVAGFIALITTV